MVKNMDEVMLSIYVATYGHEKYIKEALDSILMQETKFSYEVLVGEDASPDHTKDILKVYEKRYPGKFKMFYREKNMYNSARSNAVDLIMRCKGKYIIALEGDDFWLDSDKIEKQIEFLEMHPEYNAVAHNCLVVDGESNPRGMEYPECKDNEYTLAHFASGILPGQLTTLMYRNCYNAYYMDISILNKNLCPGDKLIYFALICNGRIYCMQECKSAYRHVTDSGTSYSATYQYNYLQMEEWHMALIEYAVRIGNTEALKIAKLLYAKNIVCGFKKKQITLRKVFKEMRKGKVGGGTILLYVKQFINHYILRKSIWI